MAQKPKKKSKKKWSLSTESEVILKHCSVWPKKKEKKLTQLLTCFKIYYIGSDRWAHIICVHGSILYSFFSLSLSFSLLFLLFSPLSSFSPLPLFTPPLLPYPGHLKHMMIWPWPSAILTISVCVPALGTVLLIGTLSGCSSPAQFCSLSVWTLELCLDLPSLCVCLFWVSFPNQAFLISAIISYPQSFHDLFLIGYCFRQVRLKMTGLDKLIYLMHHPSTVSVLPQIPQNWLFWKLER